MSSPFYPEDYEDDDQPLTVERVFKPSFRDVLRSNYRREWYGKDYFIQVGKYKGRTLSSVDSEKWIKWALNKFDSELDSDLKRALIDQFNSLFK